MISRSEKRRLIDAYRDEMSARGAIARAVIGLTIAATLVALSFFAPRDDQVTSPASPERRATSS